MTAAVASFVDATFGYGDRVVVADVSWTVGPGEWWFVVGPNGSGKSTLLKALLGAVHPLRGAVALSEDLRSKAAVGYVPQRCDANPALRTTVREYVVLGLVGVRVSAAERAARLADALERTGLRGLEAQDFWTLSGGRRRAAAVARALIRRPTLLIADEPTTGLDDASMKAMLDAFDRLRSTAGAAIVFVTHDQELARRAGARVLTVRDGRATHETA